MAQQHTYIKNINGQSKNWTSKVRVMEKSYPRTSLHSSQKYQKLILIDGQGTRVQATIFGRDIDSFANTLNILGQYYISNAIVKPIAEKHRIVNNPYQWIISTKTPVTEVPESEAKDKMIATPFSLVPFSELEKYVDSASQVDILAAAIVVFPVKTLKSGTTLMEVLLIDQELKPMILTLWNEFASNEGQKLNQVIQTQPIILGMRLKVVSYNGMTLATRSSSTFLINIATPETDALQEWLLQNEEKIQSVINENSEIPSVTIKKEPTLADVIPINILTSAKKTASSWWVKASASITNYNQKFWYTGCNVCWRSIYADHGQIFNCRNCSGQEREAEARCRFSIELVDPTGTICETIFEKVAEKIFGIDALKLMQFSDKEGCVDFESMGKMKSTSDYYFQVKANRNKTNQYIILKALATLQQDEQIKKASKTAPFETEQAGATSTTSVQEISAELPVAPTT